jgi:hypothetical protein
MGGVMGKVSKGTGMMMGEIRDGRRMWCGKG